MNAAKNLIHSFSHLFFPHICSGCGSDLINEAQLICLQCSEQLAVTHFADHQNNPVEKIFRGRVAITNAMGLLYFTKDSVLQNLLHEFKYRGKKEIGFYLGKMVGNALIQSKFYNNTGALIPLPLFASKEKIRGYNQATVLCEGISAIMNVPVLKNTIIRTSATETQTRKNRIERWQNIEGKFELKDPKSIQNKHVLLIDDVVTTGATLEACAMELLRAEGTKVSIATLAYTSA
jgi:ComF family protein